MYVNTSYTILYTCISSKYTSAHKKSTQKMLFFFFFNKSRITHASERIALAFHCFGIRKVDTRSFLRALHFSKQYNMSRKWKFICGKVHWLHVYISARTLNICRNYVHSMRLWWIGISMLSFFFYTCAIKQFILQRYYLYGLSANDKGWRLRKQVGRFLSLFGNMVIIHMKSTHTKSTTKQ